MKKLPLLLGALGGAVAGYLFKNTKLRDDLAKAKDAEQAAKVFAKHLGKDGKKIGKEVQQFMESDEVQQNLTKAKKVASEQAKKWGKELEGYVGAEAKKAKKAGTKAAKSALGKAKKSAASAKKKIAKKISKK